MLCHTLSQILARTCGRQQVHATQAGSEQHSEPGASWARACSAYLVRVRVSDRVRIRRTP